MKATQKAIEEYVSDHPYHIVVIYADWCGHCQAMKQKLGDKFQQYNYLTFLEESDVDPELLDHFPHVHIYKKGVRTDGKVEDVYKLLDLS